MKKYSRKQFIQMSAGTSVALWLAACGVDGGNEEKGADTKAEPTPANVPDKIVDKPAVELIDKNDARYDALRKGFNERIDKKPLIIALCKTTEDVAEAVRYAKAKGLPVAVKSGGHCMEGYSCNDNGVVINLSMMNKIAWLGDGKIKAGPGCLLSHVYDEILPKGVILPAGSCATVALGGLTLGGGYGIFSRKHGLTCDHLLEATMVDGNGNIVSTKDDEELLWALRGGGTGNFGIVTEMVYRTHEAPKTLQAHYLKARKLDAERAASILQKWMEVTAKLSAECFSGYVLNGSTLNILITNYGEHSAAFQELLKELAGVMDQFRSSSRGDLQHMLRNYYGVGKPLYFRNSSAGFFKGYADVEPFIKEALAKVVATPGMIYQVNTLGGKVRDAAAEKGSCFPHRVYEFVSEIQAYSTSATQHERTALCTTEVLKLTKQSGINTQYVNYCSAEFEDWEHAYYGENYKRLQAIKKKYDADDVIKHPQSVRVG